VFRNEADLINRKACFIFGWREERSVGHCSAADAIAAAWSVDEKESSAKARLTSHTLLGTRTTLNTITRMSFCKIMFISESIGNQVGDILQTQTLQ